MLALLGGGYFFLTKWEPEKDKEQAEITPAIIDEDREYLINVEKDNIDSVEINTGEKAYVVRNGEPPSIEGYKSHVIDTKALSSLLSSCSGVDISKKLDAGLDKASDFGLDNPKMSMTLTMKDKTQHKLLVGNNTNFEGEFYAMVDGGEFICTIPSYEISTIMVDPASLRVLDICTLESTEISSLTIEKGGVKEVSVLYDKDYVPQNEYQQVSFLVTYPYNGARASLDKLETILPNIVSLSADSIAEEDPADLTKYGLDKPYALIITNDKGETHNIRMGDYGEDGKVYLMYNDFPVVYLAECPFYENVKEAKASDYVDKFICLFNIDAVKKIDISMDKDKHTLEVKKKNDKEYECKKDGKLISEDRFKDMYQLVIGVLATDFVEETPSGKEKCSVTFEFNDGTKKTFKYYIYDERYSMVEADNGLKCLTLTKNLDTMWEAFK